MLRKYISKKGTFVHIKVHITLRNAHITARNIVTNVVPYGRPVEITRLESGISVSMRNTHTHVLCILESLAISRGSSATKEVLVCLGERKRPNTLANDASVDDLKLCVVREYSDAKQRSNCATDEAIASSLIRAKCGTACFSM